MSALPLHAAVLSPQLTFLVEHLDLPEAVGDVNATWEEFQLGLFNIRTLLRWDNKSRQIAWSWSCAADAVAGGILEPRATYIFVSINLEEAAEKVRYAKQIVEALDTAVQPTLLTDNRFALEFANGSRLISHPCRPVRGKAKAHVRLDEFAHYPKDREIYTSALPVLSKGGTLWMGSTPLGAQGMFWEIGTESLQKYPGYARRTIPWWHIAALCTDPGTARRVAPGLFTEERVLRFGGPRLIQIFENMPLEDFQQEYECVFVDEASAWITWDEIKRNQLDAQAGQLWFRQHTVYGARRETLDRAFEVIDETAEAIRLGQVEPVFAAGMDIGRHKHLSEIVLVGKPTTQQLPYRLGISLSSVEYEDQRALAQHCLDRLPIAQLLIDRNGLGNQLAEQLHAQYGDRAQGVDFTNESKALWAVELKVQLQRAHVPLPLERNLSYQIHSVKKKITSAKNAVFDTARNEKHHADKFWALALAVWAARADETAQAVVLKYR